MRTIILYFTQKSPLSGYKADTIMQKNSLVKASKEFFVSKK